MTAVRSTAAFLLLVLSVLPALAQRETSLGTQLGPPIGFTAKQWVSPGVALKGMWSFDITDDFISVLGADIIFHRGVHPESWNFESTPPLFAGVGLAWWPGENWTGIRVPFGFSRMFGDDGANEIYFEVAPVAMMNGPSPRDLHVGIGYRRMIRGR